MKKLVLYWTLAYPNEEDFFKILDCVEKAKTDILEIGIPVDNPFQDGRLIRESHRRVLKTGMSYEKIVTILQKIRQRYSFKIVLMTYKTAIQDFHLDKIPYDLYDGFLCPDEDINANLMKNPIKVYHEGLSIDEMKSRIKQNKFFAYVMSGQGKTGSFTKLPDGYKNTMWMLNGNIQIPIYVGFGIKTWKDAKEICENGADGVIIGSQLLNIYQQKGISGCTIYLDSLQRIHQI